MEVYPRWLNVNSICESIETSEFCVPAILVRYRMSAQLVMRSSASFVLSERALNVLTKDPSLVGADERPWQSIPPLETIFIVPTHQSAKEARFMLQGLQRNARTGAGTNRS